MFLELGQVTVVTIGPTTQPELTTVALTTLPAVQQTTTVPAVQQTTTVPAVQQTTTVPAVQQTTTLPAVQQTTVGAEPVITSAVPVVPVVTRGTVQSHFK